MDNQPDYPKIGYSVTDEDHHIEFVKVYEAKSDSFRITADVSHLDGCHSSDNAALFDPTLRKLAHRDHKQLIPKDYGFNQQYAGAYISYCAITNCKMYSPWSQMQGIFASDGFVKNFIATNNIIETASAHKISLCLLDGEIHGNTDDKGNPLEITLNGLRIGGGIAGEMPMKIVSFADECLEFKPWDEIVLDDSIVKDNRTSMPDNWICLENFRDYEGFREQARRLPSHDDDGKPLGAVAQSKLFKNLALNFGEQVEKVTRIFT